MKVIPVMFLFVSIMRVPDEGYSRVSICFYYEGT